MSNENQDQEPKNQLNTDVQFSGLAIQMGAIIAIGTFAGVKLDEKYPNKHNLFTLVLTLTSVITSIIYLIRRIIANSKKEE